jgi:hypothetical protein
MTSPDIKDVSYYEQNVAVENYDIFGDSRCLETFVVRKLYKLKRQRSPTRKPLCNHVVDVYVYCMFWQCVL